MTREEATHYLPLMQWLNAHHTEPTEIIVSNYGDGGALELGINATSSQEVEWYMNFCKELYLLVQYAYPDNSIPLAAALALYTLATGKVI